MCDGFGECLGACGLVYGNFVEGYCHSRIDGPTIIGIPQSLFSVGRVFMEIGSVWYPVEV